METVTFKKMDLKICPCPWVIPPSCPSPLPILGNHQFAFSSLQISSNFLEFYVSGIIQYSFCLAFLLIIILRFIHAACFKVLYFLLSGSIPLHGYNPNCLTIHLMSNCFQCVAIINRASGTPVDTSMYGCVLLFPWVSGKI